MTNGYPDKTKFECTVRTGMDSAFSDKTGTPLEVVALLNVPNENNAMQILVNGTMTDNANACVTFKDKRVKSNIDTTNTVNFRLADAREPSVLSVEAKGSRKIEITFTEAVLPHLDVKSDPVDTTSKDFGGFDRFAAQNLNNYLIDGRPLSEYGIIYMEREQEFADLSSSEIAKTEKQYPDESLEAKDGKVTLQSYKVTDGKGEDNRHKVTITVGSSYSIPSGSHVLTVRNVGDWAARTDQARNSISTQALPFEVTANDQKPDFTVDIQSPEQYRLNFNEEFKVADSSEQFKTKNSADESSILQLEEYVNGAWTPISNGKAAESSSGRNPVTVSRIGYDNTKYLVEVRRDWSEVYDFNRTRTDYYNKRLRLHVDAGKLVNVSNGLRNDEINIELNANDAKVTSGGEIMSGMDEKSPEIKNVERAKAKNGKELNSWNVEFNEPVKISSTANKEGLTPSQRQQEGVNASSEAKLRENQGVPVAFARFVNVSNPSTIVEGIVDESAFINAEDTVINVEPQSPLSGGDWRLVVGSVSDDYGSTLATDSRVITIDETAAVTDFKVVWAAVSRSPKYNESQMGHSGSGKRGSYVFVKFNKAVDLATALDENNYALNNQPLPQGASVQADIDGYDEHDGTVDSVTIVLPTNSGLLYGNSYSFDLQNTLLSISGVKSSAGEELTVGSGMNQLPYNIGEGTKDEADTSNSNGVKVLGLSIASDAVWGNAPSEQYRQKDTTEDDYINEWSEYYKALKAALDNDQYRRIEIQRDAFDGLKEDSNNSDDVKAKLAAARSVFGKDLTISINRAVDVDFSDEQGRSTDLYGNITVSASDTVDQMMISGVIIEGTRSDSSRKNGASLTVKAGTVKEFIFDGTVKKGGNTNAILINDAWSESFVLTENAVVDGPIYVNDTNGFGFTNKLKNSAVKLIIDSNGVINLKGSFVGANVTLEQAAELNFIADSDGKDAELTRATVNIKADGTKVMLKDATADPVHGPEINIIGNNVKVYCEDIKGQSGWLKNAGGSIITVNKDGKTESDNYLNETLKVNEKGGIKKILDSLRIASESTINDIEYEAYAQEFTSGSAFVMENTDNTNGKPGINISETQNKIKELIVSGAEEQKYWQADGTTIKEKDVAVTVALADRANAKIFEQQNGYIYPKTDVGTGRDTIVITVSYAGNNYTRSIKVTN